MIKSSITNFAEINRISSQEELNTFNKKLSKYINKEVHIKIEQDDSPINYILKEIGKDYVVVLFAHMERVIPIQRIIYIQQETRVRVLSSPI